jgi:hypothetical protein
MLFSFSLPVSDDVDERPLRPEENSDKFGAAGLIGPFQTTSLSPPLKFCFTKIDRSQVFFDGN